MGGSKIERDKPLIQHNTDTHQETVKEITKLPDKKAVITGHLFNAYAGKALAMLEMDPERFARLGLVRPLSMAQVTYASYELGKQAKDEDLAKKLGVTVREIQHHKKNAREIDSWSLSLTGDNKNSNLGELLMRWGTNGHNGNGHDGETHALELSSVTGYTLGETGAFAERAMTVFEGVKKTLR